MESYVALSNLDFVIRWVLLCIALYRISWDMAERSGIFGWCEAIRQFVTKHTKAEWLREFIRCPLCSSMLMAFFIVPIFFPILSLEGYFLVVCSLSGGVLLVHFLTYRWITA